jgi:hypothetical protein
VAADACSTRCLWWWSTMLPNQMPVKAVATRKIPAMTPVAKTERVSR